MSLVAGFESLKDQQHFRFILCSKLVVQAVSSQHPVSADMPAVAAILPHHVGFLSFWNYNPSESWLP